MNQPLPSPSMEMTLEEGPYGPWVVIVADDGRRLGVAVTPYRCRTHLLIHDIDAPPRTYGSLNLPPTSNPWLRRVVELTNGESDYHWDTPVYRTLCEQGGLDPDYRRPAFDPENAEAGEALLVELNRTNLSSGAANIFMDIVDHLRIDPWVSERKSIETIRHNVRFNAEYDAKVIDEVRELLSRLPALLRLRLM
jgi:hypothetical protein